MAPPNFPQGMTLHSIGYAALKYPELDDSLPIPLNNQVGVLQRVPPELQNHMIAQIASQYLDTFFEYQTSDNALLNDKISSQYYFSSVLILINFLTTSPDVCIRVAKHPTILNSLIERMLSPTFEEDMKAASRPSIAGFPPATFDADFGTLLQFLSTLLLYPAEITSLHPNIKDLIPKCKTWRTKYKRSSVRTISNASDRLITQIEGMDPFLISEMRKMQAQSLCCGKVGCRKKEGLIACGKCRIQRYCGQEHQKGDWKYHKKICMKGLVESEDSEWVTEEILRS